MNAPSQSPEPILCAHLLRRVDSKLIGLLAALRPEEWDLPTIVPGWQVREIAAHLLDTALRKLSAVRDSHRLDDSEIRSPRDVVGLVNRLNQEGVTVYRRLSPPVLIDLMKLACEQSARFHEALDPFAPAVFAVSWAGEQTSANWFDTARELTERWHHQEQIRLATRQPSLVIPELYHPVLDCFARGLPYLYRDVQAPVGTVVQLKIRGECGGEWFLCRQSAGWQLIRTPGGEIASTVAIPQELAWRVFTKGIARNAAREMVEIQGNRELGEKALQLTAIVG